MRVALGDVVSVETLAFLVALERARDREVEYELTSFAKEELAIQCIVNGQANLGVGRFFELYSSGLLMEQFWALLFVLFAFAFTINEVLVWLEGKLDFYAASRH